MGTANLNARRVVPACSEAIKYVREERAAGPGHGVTDGKAIEKMLSGLRALAMCAIADLGDDATVIVGTT